MAKLNFYKRTILLIVSLISLYGYGQEKNIKKSENPTVNNFFSKDRLFTGGNMGAQFGNSTFLDISPLIGYRFTDDFAGGVGITYRYLSFNNGFNKFQNNIVGGRIFTRYNILERLFLYGEYEVLNSDWYQNKKRINLENILAGAGYTQFIGERASISLMGLWNLYYSPFPVYNNPVIRMGLNIGL